MQTSYKIHTKHTNTQTQFVQYNERKIKQEILRKHFKTILRSQKQNEMLIN